MTPSAPQSLTHAAKRLIWTLALPAVIAGCADQASPTDTPLEPVLDPTTEALQSLGKRIFEDRNLSIRRDQSCASCHAAAWGFRGSGEVSQGGVFQGSIPGRFGSRTPLSAAYASFAPEFAQVPATGAFVGGNFWDGRATGGELGDPTAEQARGPFVNPVEQALPDIACVVLRVSRSGYAAAYRAAWGDAIARINFPAGADDQCGVEGTQLTLSSPDRDQVRLEYDRIARTLSAFEASDEVNRFSSRFDAWLRGEVQMTQQEQMGFMLFQGRGRCSTCHSVAGPNPLFTDFGYHNVGTPPNPSNPATERDPTAVDLGLGAPGGAAPGPAQWGLVRTPTLRNVDARPFPGAEKSFMHNGALTSLREVVQYYNTRDVLGPCAPDAPRTSWGSACWPAPSVKQNLNTADMGNLLLADFQIDAIVTFLRMLTDGYTP